jgi:hypothetical protein
MPELTARSAHIARAVAIAIAVLIPLGLLFAWVMAPIPDCANAHWALQTAGTAGAASDIPVGATGCDFGTSLVIDLALIAGYVAAFTLLIDRGGRRLRSLSGRRAANRLRWLPPIIGGIDIIQNALMAQWGLPSGYTADWQARWVAAVSMPWLALILVMLFAGAASVWALADDS